MSTPYDLEQRFEIAADCFLAEQFEEARIRCQELMHQHPFIADLHNLLALSLFKLKQFDASTLHSEAAVKLAPEREDFLLSLADIYFEMEDFARAMNCYQRLMLNNPINSDFSSRVEQCLKQLS